MIQLMKQKVDLRSLEEDRSVILTYHIHWNHFYGCWKWGVFGYGGLLRKINGNPHVNSRTLDIIPCNVTGYPTQHDPVPGGQVPPWLCNGPNLLIVEVRLLALFRLFRLIYMFKWYFDCPIAFFTLTHVQHALAKVFLLSQLDKQSIMS